MNTYNWRNKALRRIDTLINIAPGWDGYTGKPAQPAIAWFVLAMLEDIMEPDTPGPAIMPNSDGFIQVEWHIGDTDIELFVTAPKNVRGYYYHPCGGMMDSIAITDDFTIVKEWLRDAIETAKVET